MNSHLKLAFGGAAVLAMIMVFAAGRSPPVVAEEPSFDTNWKEAAVAVTLAATQTPAPELKVVKTETILPEIIARPEELTPKLRRKLIIKSDVCQRHGMRKVHYGKRWRCKR